MSTGFDENFDWTGGSPTPQGEAAAAAAAAPPEDFVIPEVQAAHDVKQIEEDAAARDYQNPKPGDYTFLVAGFWKAPERISKQGYVGGQPVTYHPYKVGVRLAVDGLPNVSILDFFELPPTDPQEVAWYQQAKTRADSDAKDAGFGSRKFEQFLSKLGFVFPRGGTIPAEARLLKNWVGRKVFATVIPGQPDKTKVDANGHPKINPTTGMPFEVDTPRPQVKLFSYREAGAAPPSQPAQGNGAAHGQGAQSQQAAPQQAAPQQAAPQQAAPQQAQANLAPAPQPPPGAAAQQFAQSGLANLM